MYTLDRFNIHIFHAREQIFETNRPTAQYSEATHDSHFLLIFLYKNDHFTVQNGPPGGSKNRTSRNGHPTPWFKGLNHSVPLTAILAPANP